MDKKELDVKIDYLLKGISLTQGQKNIFRNIIDSLIEGIKEGIVLPEIVTATSDAIGGIKLGYTENDKNYAIKLDGNGKAYVTVPWVDTNTTYDNATISTAGLMSAADKQKLDNIEANANNYSLPTASSTVKGGITLGYTENGKNYPVEIDSSGKAFVNVPWTDTNTTYSAATVTTLGLVKQAAAIDALVDSDEITTVISTLNTLIANLKTAGIIANS